MWHLGPHNRSLFRLYHFRDPNLEEQYRTSERPNGLLSLRIYLVVSLALAVQEVGTETIRDPMPIIFWCHVAVVVLSALLFLSSWFVCAIQRDPLVFHTLFCLVLSIYYGAMVPINGLRYGQQAVVDGEANWGRWPEFMKMLARQRAADAAVMYCTMYNFNHWVCHALQGFKLPTIAAFFISLGGFLGGTYSSPYTTSGMRINGLLYNVFITFAMLYVALVIERSRRSNFMARILLTRELQASQMADSMLNHMLKNTLADVAANIEIFLEGSLGPDALVDSIACLRRGIRCCKERQVYLKLVSQEYTPVLNNVNLRQFGQQLIMGRDVETSFWDATALLDAALYNLILENALSNAFKHGHPERPAVCMRIFDCSDEALPQELPAHHRRLCIEVSNNADPQRSPLHPSMAAQLFAPEVKVQTTAIYPVLSDGVGLRHCLMAAKLANINLSLSQKDNRVTFTAIADVRIDQTTVSEEDQQVRTKALAERCPPGLRFVCIDDSLAAQRLLKFHIQKFCEPAFVRCFGACEADVELFLDAALLHADVVIMDQHLEYSMTYLGTDLAQHLVTHGFSGLICIRSADDSVEDRTKYTASGAHCALGKDMLGPEMVEELKAAYVRLRGFREPTMMTDCLMDCNTSTLDNGYTSQPSNPLTPVQTFITYDR